MVRMAVLTTRLLAGLLLRSNLLIEPLSGLTALAASRQLRAITFCCR
jgi:hypothetical protein